MEERIQSYVSRTESEGMLRAIGEATQQLEKEVQVAAFGTVMMGTQRTQALIGTIRGELHAQMEADHQEVQR